MSVHDLFRRRPPALLSLLAVYQLAAEKLGVRLDGPSDRDAFIEAVREYQRRERLQVDGDVGVQTLARMMGLP